MKTEYLHWHKDLDVQFQGRWQEVHSLLSSAVSEPRDLLASHLARFQGNGLDQYQHLSSAWGHPVLTERLANRYGVDAGSIVTTNGVSNGIYLLSAALLNSSSHVVIESPVYEPLVASPHQQGADIAFVPRRSPRYEIDPEELASRVRPDTTLVILCNLHNPTSSLLSDDLLRDVGRRCRAISPSVYIVVDEVYHDFVMDQCRPAAAIDTCFITLNSLTKVYGLGCLHCGWIIADRPIVERIRRFQTLVEGSYPRLLEDINAYLFQFVDEYWQRSIKQVDRNRETLRTTMQPLLDSGVLDGDIPSQGCIFFPRINGVPDTGPLVSRLAEEHDIYVVTGRFFGESTGIRIGFGGEPHRTTLALQKLAEAIEHLARRR